MLLLFLLFRTLLNPFPDKMRFTGLLMCKIYRTDLPPTTNGPPPPPPQAGWVKINVNAAFKSHSAYFGIILRNASGSISLATSVHHSCLDAITAKCLAILDAVIILQNHNTKKVIIESDCLNAASFINGSSYNSSWTANPVVDQIKRIRNG
ncbi:hypothetical protein CASFOL_012705 [Castilleja foliolosa]|uniref:RNase H type-1 domain-containing protein n=1 Tax=Castilleja foliolosa TaxID=1961234 RepID=A0ABD3DLZ2_9LAMI